MYMCIDKPLRIHLNGETLSICSSSSRLEQDLEIHPTKPRFTYLVSILDLDPKPYENIPHQYKLDSKIVNYYLRSTQAKQDLPAQSLYLGLDREDCCTLVLHPV